MIKKSKSHYKSHTNTSNLKLQSQFSVSEKQLGLPPSNAKESGYKSRDVSEVRENDSEKQLGMYKTINKEMLHTEARGQENDLL